LIIGSNYRTISAITENRRTIVRMIDSSISSHFKDPPITAQVLDLLKQKESASTVWGEVDWEFIGKSDGSFSACLVIPFPMKSVFVSLDGADVCIAISRATNWTWRRFHPDPPFASWFPQKRLGWWKSKVLMISSHRDHYDMQKSSEDGSRKSARMEFCACWGCGLQLEVLPTIVNG
jgi:hypothetical protein